MLEKLLLEESKRLQREQAAIAKTMRELNEVYEAYRASMKEKESEE